MIIHLVGPGGAGKSTVGAALAAQLDWPFLDLDSEFMSRVGDISEVIDREGYETYAHKNVETYVAVAEASRRSLIALSSGFMTYPERIHPQYARIRSRIALTRGTVVLLPSLDLEICVQETVRRQLARPFARSAGKEESVIRERYGIYMAVPAAKVETMMSVDEVVEQIIGLLAPNRTLRPTTRDAHGVEP